jgi:hypothetical protein
MLKASIPNVLSVYCTYMLQVFQTYVVRLTFHSHLLAAAGPVCMHVAMWERRGASSRRGK